MAIEPVVRRATTGDLASLVAIDEAARSALVDHRGGEAWLAEHPALSTVLASEVGASAVVDHSVVGVIDDVIVGFAVGEIDEDPRRGGIMRVDRVHVVAEARELGFGDALLATLIGIGRDRGCRFVEGQALPGDRETKNLYERAGITARLITVSRRLDG